MTDRHRIFIKSGTYGKTTEMFVDGFQLRGIRHIDVDFPVSGAVTLRVEMYPETIEIQIDGDEIRALPVEKEPAESRSEDKASGARTGPSVAHRTQRT